MTELSIWTREEVAEFDGVCELLTSASGCSGLRDEVAQELDREVLRLLNGVAGQSRDDRAGRRPRLLPQAPS